MSETQTTPSVAEKLLEQSIKALSAALSTRGDALLFCYVLEHTQQIAFQNGIDKATETLTEGKNLRQLLDELAGIKSRAETEKERADRLARVVDNQNARINELQKAIAQQPAAKANYVESDFAKRDAKLQQIAEDREAESENRQTVVRQIAAASKGLTETVDIPDDIREATHRWRMVLQAWTSIDTPTEVAHVLNLSVRGMANIEIARQLGIPTKRVDNYVERHSARITQIAKMSPADQASAIEQIQKVMQFRLDHLTRYPTAPQLDEVIA